MTTQVQQHTPGPWDVSGDGFAVFGADGHLVARCNPTEDEPTDAEWSEAETNARLIAAATDLLAALLRLMAAFSHAHTSDAEAYTEAQAAIRKATGEGS